MGGSYSFSGEFTNSTDFIGKYRSSDKCHVSGHSKVVPNYQQYSVQYSVRYSVYDTGCTKQFARHSVYGTGCTVQCARYSVYGTVCTVQFARYRVPHGTGCSTVQCARYSVQLVGTMSDDEIMNVRTVILNMNTMKIQSLIMIKVNFCL